MSILERPVTPTADIPRPTDRNEQPTLLWSILLVIGGFLMVVMVVGLLALAFVSLAQDGGGSGDDAIVSDLDITLSEFSIDGDLTAPTGDVVLNVVNSGAIEHNVAVRGLGINSASMMAGGADTLGLGKLEPGTYELFCSISGHEASGMLADLVITEAGEPESADAVGGGHGDGHDGVSPEQLDQAMIDSMLAFPAATEGVGNQVLEPEVLADGTKKFTLTAEVVPWEVSPGEIVDAWAYNGQVPGPQIKVDIGDNVQIELTNLTPTGTDIHWHGIHTPNDQDGVSPLTQDPIATGETFTYEFVAEDSAIGMYHAHLHSQTSVINGMFAAFQIGDTPLPLGRTVSGVTIPDELDLAFDKPLVLNDAGTIGLSLNGKSFPATEPFVMDEGEWGVIHYYNEGLTAHPMHLHQFPQLVFAKDGFPLDSPYFADTINVAPGERYSVLVQADTPGTWVFHCHILTHVERAEGMFGMVTALVVNPKT